MSDFPWLGPALVIFLCLVAYAVVLWQLNLVLRAGEKYESKKTKPLTMFEED